MRPHLRVTELADLSGLHKTPQLLGHGLHSVTDAKHGNPSQKNGCWGSVGLCLGHGHGAAREDDSLEAIDLPDLPEAMNKVIRHITGMNLAVHAGFTHTARNQLGELRAKVKNENLGVGSQTNQPGSLLLPS